MLASWCGQSREKKDNWAGSFPAGIGHCLSGIQIYFLIRNGLGRILPGQNIQTGARSSTRLGSGFCFSSSFSQPPKHLEEGSALAGDTGWQVRCCVLSPCVPHTSP